MMLDQEHGDAKLVADRTDENAELRHLIVIEPAGGFVEQQEPRLRGQRAGELDALARRKGQARRRVGCGGFQSDESQHRARGAVAMALLAAGGWQRHGVAQGSVAAARMGADLDVVEHRHGGEQSRALEGAADALGGDVRRCAVAQRRSIQADVAALRPIEPAQAIEQCGLAGAVRPDQSDDPAIAHREVDVLKRDDAAEPHGQICDLEQRRRRAVVRSGRCPQRCVGHGDQRAIWT
jgi:hypothetical protein